ncbi:hypothetical protein ACFLZM_00120 [Thermodesulfobacteriota bacterium]
MMNKIKSVSKQLTKDPQWVGWLAKKKPGQDKPLKIPIDPNESILTWARSNDPKTWGAFKQARSAVKRFDLDGIGFVLSPDDPFVVIDLDECLDPETGTLTEQAFEIIEYFNSYCEVSPSGAGVHIWIKTDTLPPSRRTQGIEIYTQNRFMTVTGNHLPETPTKIRLRTKKLNKFIQQRFNR